MKRFIFLFFFLGFSCAIWGQLLQNPFRTLKEPKQLVYGIDNRRTHIFDHPTLIYGIYTGIGFGNKLKLKLGLSGTPFEKGRLIDEQGLLTRNRFYSINLGEEFDFLVLHKFSFTTYVQGGIGYNYFRKINTLSEEVARGKNLFVPLELGTNLNYEVTPWLRAKAGLGWRFVFPESSSDLSGYYLKTGFIVDTERFLEFWKMKKGRTIG
jgi:hypothetical protein